MAVDCSRLAANVAAASCRVTGHAVREVALVNFDDWAGLQGAGEPPVVEHGEETPATEMPEGGLTNAFTYGERREFAVGDRLRVRYVSGRSDRQIVLWFLRDGGDYMTDWTTPINFTPEGQEDEWHEHTFTQSGHGYLAVMLATNVTLEYELTRASSPTSKVVEVVDGVVKIRPDGADHKVFNFFETADKGIVAAAEEVVGPYFNAFRHRVTLRSFDRPQALKDYINSTTNGRFVAFVRFDVQDPTAVPTSPDFVVFGAANGLTAEASAFDSSNGDGQTGEVTLASEDGRLEGGEALPLYGNGQDGTAATPAAAWEWVESNRVE